MQILLIILIMLASVLLSFLVLIQEPKGGGLASGFSGGTNLMGVKRTGDFLEKGTWGLVIAIMVFALIVNVMGPSSSTGGGSGLTEQITPTAAPSATPAPMTAPEAANTPEITDTAQ